MEGLRQLHGIAVAHHVHVHGRGLGAQQVIMERGDIDAAFFELLHHGVHLVLQQDEIAHHHRCIVDRLEGQPTTEREAGFERDTVEAHLQIRARQADAVDAAGLYRAGFAERLADGVPVGLGGERRRGERRRKRESGDETGRG